MVLRLCLLFIMFFLLINNIVFSNFRSCIGKKLAETQLQLTLANVVRNFDFSIVNSKDVDDILKMVLVPSEEIRFEFNALK